MITMHRLADRAAFEQSMPMYVESIAKRLDWLRKGHGDEQAICQSILHDSLWNACIVLILGRDEADASRYLQQGIHYGLRSFGAIGSTGGPRVYHVELEFSEEGMREIAAHEVKPPRNPSPRKLTIDQYARVLMMAVAFGTRPQIEAAAEYPEEKYRNPNIVVKNEHYFTWWRAAKAYLLGDEVMARRDAGTALAALRGEPAVAAHVEMFLRLLDRDQKGFLTHLEKRLIAHKKQYEKKPGDPEGVICQPALMLCRLGIERGLKVEEQPYLPLRFVPGYTGPRCSSLVA